MSKPKSNNKRIPGHKKRLEKACQHAGVKNWVWHVQPEQPKPFRTLKLYFRPFLWFRPLFEPDYR